MSTIKITQNRSYFGVLFLLTGLLGGCSAHDDAPQKSSARAQDVPAAADDVTAKNKKLVTDFYTLAFEEKKIKQAADQYVGDPYIQHNPQVADGKDAFVSAIGLYIESVPQLTVTVTRVVAEGDLVVVHSLFEIPQQPSSAVMDIFRVDKGKIVEHWDVQQEIPEVTASGHPMV